MAVFLLARYFFGILKNLRRNGANPLGLLTSTIFIARPPFTLYVIPVRGMLLSRSAMIICRMSSACYLTDSVRMIFPLTVTVAASPKTSLLTQ